MAITGLAKAIVCRGLTHELNRKQADSLCAGMGVTVMDFDDDTVELEFAEKDTGGVMSIFSARPLFRLRLAWEKIDHHVFFAEAIQREQGNEVARQVYRGL